MQALNYFISGNVFSSLRGLELQWSLHSDTSEEEEAVVDANSILRYFKAEITGNWLSYF